MKKTFLTLAFLLCCTGLLFSNTNQINLSGSWKLDESREYPQTRLTLVAVDFDQTADTLRVTRHYRDPRNETVVLTEALPFDGNPYHMEYMGIPRQSSVEWSENHDALFIKIIITFTRNGETQESITLEKWALKEANTLLLERTSPSIPDDQPIVYTFNRKQ